jgi:hypothetical protein
MRPFPDLSVPIGGFGEGFDAKSQAVAVNFNQFGVSNYDVPDVGRRQVPHINFDAHRDFTIGEVLRYPFHRRLLH